MAGLAATEGVKGTFDQQAVNDQSALTASALAGIPPSEWAAKIEASGQPANLDDFKQNLNNMLEQGERGSSRLNYARNIAQGKMDRQIEKFKNNDGLLKDNDMSDPAQRREVLEAFAESKIPDAVKLEGHRTVYRETFVQAYEERLAAGEDGLGRKEAKAFVDKAEGIYDQISEQYREQIDKAVEQASKPPEPEAAPDAGPETPSVDQQQPTVAPPTATMV